MFTIGKLLIESPEKIVKLLIVLLKVALTFWIASFFSDTIPLNTKDISMDKIFSDVSVFDTIYYLAVSVFFWFLIWEFLFVLVFQFLAYSFSLLFKDETAFRIYLKLTGIAKFNGDKLEKINPAITWFTKSLEEQAEKPSIVTIDFVEIGGVSILAFSALCYSGHIYWYGFPFWIAMFFLLNFSLNAILQKKWVEYYDSQRPKLRAEFYAFGKQQELKESIELVDFLADNYQVIVKRKFIELIIKPECHIDWLPKSIVFRHLFIPDEQIASRILSEVRGKIKEPDNSGVHKKIYISNVINARNDDSIISANTKDEMYIRIKDLVLRWKKQYYATKLLNDMNENG